MTVVCNIDRISCTALAKTVRDLGMLKADQQLEYLIEWLGKMHGALLLDTFPIALNL